MSRPNKSTLLENLQPGKVLLPPLVIRSHRDRIQRDGLLVDALITAAVPGETTSLQFIVMIRTTSTLDAIHAAASQAKLAAIKNEWPLVQVPYLSTDHAELLSRLDVSGIDLCGNGIICIRDRFYAKQSDRPNKYARSQLVVNPYRGKSALVARTLLTATSWSSLNKLVHAINQGGVSVSQPQVSMAIRSLEAKLLVGRSGGTMQLQDPTRLLDKLGSEWHKSVTGERAAFRINAATAQWANRFSADKDLHWAVTGESSAAKYVVFTQGGPTRIAVSDLALATKLLGGDPEPIPNFADIELLETREPGFFFQARTDETGTRWASQLQVWLELQAGDARQQSAARDIRHQILASIK